MHPVGADVHQVDVITLAKLLVDFRVAGIFGSPWESSFLQGLLRPFDILREDIAESDDLDAGDVGEAGHSSRTPHSEPDETYPYGIHCRYRKTDDILLPCRPGRNLYLDGTCGLVRRASHCREGG